MAVTKNLAKYTKKKAINLSAMSRATGIPYGALYASLGDTKRGRPLSVDEALLVCKFLGEKIEDFADKPEKGVKRNVRGNTKRSGMYDTAYRFIAHPVL